MLEQPSHAEEVVGWRSLGNSPSSSDLPTPSNDFRSDFPSFTSKPGPKSASGTTNGRGIHHLKPKSTTTETNSRLGKSKSIASLRELQDDDTREYHTSDPRFGSMPLSPQHLKTFQRMVTPKPPESVASFTTDKKKPKKLHRASRWNHHFNHIPKKKDKDHQENGFITLTERDSNLMKENSEGVPLLRRTASFDSISTRSTRPRDDDSMGFTAMPWETSRSEYSSIPSVAAGSPRPRRKSSKKDIGKRFRDFWKGGKRKDATWSEGRSSPRYSRRVLSPISLTREKKASRPSSRIMTPEPSVRSGRDGYESQGTSAVRDYAPRIARSETATETYSVASPASLEARVSMRRKTDKALSPIEELSSPSSLSPDAVAPMGRRSWKATDNWKSDDESFLQRTVSHRLSRSHSLSHGVPGKSADRRSLSSRSSRQRYSISNPPGDPPRISSLRPGCNKGLCPTHVGDEGHDCSAHSEGEPTSALITIRPLPKSKSTPLASTESRPNSAVSSNDRKSLLQQRRLPGTSYSYFPNAPRDPSNRNVFDLWKGVDMLSVECQGFKDSIDSLKKELLELRTEKQALMREKERLTRGGDPNVEYDRSRRSSSSLPTDERSMVNGRLSSENIHGKYAFVTRLSTQQTRPKSAYSRRPSPPHKLETSFRRVSPLSDDGDGYAAGSDNGSSREDGVHARPVSQPLLRTTKSNSGTQTPVSRRSSAERERLQSAQTELRQLLSVSTALRTELNTLNVRLEAIEDESDSVVARSGMMEEELVDALKKITELRSQLSESVKDLLGQVNDLSSQKSGLEQDQTQLLESINLTQSKLKLGKAELTSVIENGREDLHRLETELREVVEAKDKVRDEMRLQLSELKSEEQELLARLQDLRDEVGILKRQNNNMERERHLVMNSIQSQSQGDAPSLKVNNVQSSNNSQYLLPSPTPSAPASFNADPIPLGERSPPDASMPRRFSLAKLKNLQSTQINLEKVVDLAADKVAQLRNRKAELGQELQSLQQEVTDMGNRRRLLRDSADTPRDLGQSPDIKEWPRDSAIFGERFYQEDRGDELEMQNKKIKEEIEMLEKERVQCESERTDAVAKLEAVQLACSETQRQCSAWESRHAMLQESLDQLIADGRILEAERNKLTAAQTQLQEQVFALRLQKDQQTSMLQTLQFEIEDLEEQRQTKEDTSKLTKSNIQAVEMEQAELLQKLDKVRTQNQELRNAQDQLKVKNRGTQQDMDKLQRDKEDLESKLSQLKIKKDEMSKTLETLKKDNQELESKSSELRHHQQELKQSMTQLEKLNFEYTNKSSRLREDIQGVESELAGLAKVEDEIKGLRGERALLDKEKEVLEEHLRLFEGHNKHIRDSVDRELRDARDQRRFSDSLRRITSPAKAGMLEMEGASVLFHSERPTTARPRSAERATESFFDDLRFRTDRHTIMTRSRNGAGSIKSLPGTVRSSRWQSSGSLDGDKRSSRRLTSPISAPPSPPGPIKIGSDELSPTGRAITEGHSSTDLSSPVLAVHNSSPNFSVQYTYRTAADLERENAELRRLVMDRGYEVDQEKCRVTSLQIELTHVQRQLRDSQPGPGRDRESTGSTNAAGLSRPRIENYMPWRLSNVDLYGRRSTTSTHSHTSERRRPVSQSSDTMRNAHSTDSLGGREERSSSLPPTSTDYRTSRVRRYLRTPGSGFMLSREEAHGDVVI